MEINPIIRRKQAQSSGGGIGGLIGAALGAGVGAYTGVGALQGAQMGQQAGSFVGGVAKPAQEGMNSMQRRVSSPLDKVNTAAGLGLGGANAASNSMALDRIEGSVSPYQSTLDPAQLPGVPVPAMPVNPNVPRGVRPFIQSKRGPY